MATDENNTQPTLGEFLRQERERRGITIEQVASATKISVRLLHLLESDQYAELPAKPFVRGFVNSYCRFIGLDSKEVLIRYGKFIEEHSHDRPTRDEGHSGYAFEKKESEQSRTILSIVMVAFIVLGGVAFAIIKPKLHHHPNSRIDKLRRAHASPSPSPSSSFTLIPVPTAVPSVLVFTPSPSPRPIHSARPIHTPKPSPHPSPRQSPRPSPRPSRQPSPHPSPSPSFSQRPDPLNSGINLKPSQIKYKVIFRAHADTWVRYQDDQRPVMKFILRSGRILVLRAQQQIKFQASNPQGIFFRVNYGPSRQMMNDPNVAMRGKDLTLFFPKQLAETIQDPFPGQPSIQGIYIPPHWVPKPQPSPSK